MGSVILITRLNTIHMVLLTLVSLKNLITLNTAEISVSLILAKDSGTRTDLIKDLGTVGEYTLELFTRFTLTTQAILIKLLACHMDVEEEDLCVGVLWLRK
jgi:hypothetical protein